MNGKPGDAAVTDIVVYERPVFHSKVDDLIRELHAAGGLDHQLARSYVDMADETWRKIACFVAPDKQADREAVDDAARTWLRNFSFELYLCLADLRDPLEPSESRRLPNRWDPLVGDGGMESDEGDGSAADSPP